MRVLHLHSGNLYGGVETFLVTLARGAHLAPDMAQTFVLSFEGRLARELTAAGHAPGMLGQARLSRPRTVWRVRRSLADYLRSHEVDIAVCHQAWPHVMFARTIQQAGLPLVLWLHTVNDRIHWLDRWASLRPPNLVVCNSRFTAACHAPRFPRTRTEWVYCPLTPRSRVDITQRERTRASLETAADDVAIIQVGRLESLKGHRKTLEALGQLRDLAAWTYWIVGGPQRPSDEDYLHELQAMARGLGIGDRVRFLGERTDVASLLGAADVYCQPNLRPEAFGLSLVEALAAGLPVVTSGIGGACEIVDESCGILTPVGDALAVAAALRALVTDSALRERLGSEGLRRPDVLCHEARQIQRIQAILSSVGRADTPVYEQGSSC